MNILVLDAGTSSMRGTLWDHTFSALYSSQIEYHPIYGGNGMAEQDPKDWLVAMKRLCAEAARKGKVDAIALTSQRSSVIPADEHGNPLMNAIMWQDTRNQTVCQGLSGHEALIHGICGTGVNTVYSGGKMSWLKQIYPEVYHRAAYLFVIPDYLLYHLTGRHVTDHTYGSRSMLMDLRRREWSDELLSIFGLDRTKLGRLIGPASIVGTVTETFSKETGCPARIPVITCGGDQQCSAVGQGVFTSGSVSVNLGTGAYLVMPVLQVPERLNPALTCNASAVPGEYILEAGVLACGAALDWFLKEFSDDMSLVGESLRNSPPGAGGITMLPYFQGRTNLDWNSNARATFSGISLSTSKLDLLRALLESICVEITLNLRMMAEDNEPRELRLSGGLSQSPELCQLLSDVTGIRVIRADDSDATSRGAWMSAINALGLVESWERAWDLAYPVSEHIFIPRLKRTEQYREIARRMEALYEATK